MGGERDVIITVKQILYYSRIVTIIIKTSVHFFFYSSTPYKSKHDDIQVICFPHGK